MKEALENGHSVIVDNQNRDTKTRKHYIDIASSLLDIQSVFHHFSLSETLYSHLVSVPVRGIYFSLPKELSFHMNTYRTVSEQMRLIFVLFDFFSQLIETSSEYRSDKVPPMVIHSFYKSREPPQVIHHTFFLLMLITLLDSYWKDLLR